MNICRLLALSVDGPQRCLVLELCPGGTLSDRLAGKVAAGCARPDPLSCRQRVRIALGVARALEHLHGLQPQMVHRDLKVRGIGGTATHSCGTHMKRSRQPH